MEVTSGEERSQASGSCICQCQFTDKETHYPYRTTLEPQMLLRKAIQKTKIFFHKTLQNLKSILFGDYQKLTKAHPLNPLYCSNSNQEMQQLDQFYGDVTDQWESDNDKVMRKSKKTAMSAKEPMKEEGACCRSFMKFEGQSSLKNKHEERENEEKKIGSSHEGKRGEPGPQIANGGGYSLAQKMKELEMMDMNDVDHVLDIEEVLHYYSRLKCPVYLDIVDKFFMDMHSEFILPHPSASISISSRRLGPLKF